MLAELLSNDFSLMRLIVGIVSALVVVFLTLPIHEWAHVFAATKLGDPTPRYQGRLTLNPFAHIDYVGALCIILFGVGWAKPVQVNHLNFKNPKRDMALTALAGPVSNILMALVFNIIAYAIWLTVGAPEGIGFYLFLFCDFVVQINVSLAVFNLIPIPPLDGSRILTAVLPDRTYYKIMQYERYIYLGFLLLLFTNVLDKPIMFLSNAITGLLDLICNGIFKIFL